MRRPRLKALPGTPRAQYHCLSRVVDRQFVFGTPEKEHFAALMRECEEFCEVQVLTFCLMSNHFHILVEVPCRPDRLPTPEDILAKLSRLTGRQDVEGVRQRFEMYRRNQDVAGEQAYLASFHSRLWDLSMFMKLLKQRLTQWFNRRQGRKGTLWEERFKSVLVEGMGHSLATMAGYIDLNPVRAGLVTDPKDYRWSGYGEAMAGCKRAQQGLQKIVTALQRGEEQTVNRTMEAYRMHVYRESDETGEETGQGDQPMRGASKRKAVMGVLQEKGKVPLTAYLTCRVRYFCDGAIFGGREFVEDAFQNHRKWFGPKRRTGARKMRGLEITAPLFTVRDLRLKVFG